MAEVEAPAEALPQRPARAPRDKPVKEKPAKEKPAAAAAADDEVEAPATLPDEAEVNAQVAALEEFAAHEKEKINNLRAILRDKDAVRQAAKAEVEAQRVRLDAAKAQFNSKMQEKNELMPKVNSRTDTEKELKKQKRELQYGSVQELEAAIRQLEFDMSHSSLSLKEEKDMLAQIKRLNGLKDQIRNHEAQWDEFTKGKDDQDALVAILRVKNEELSAIRAVNQQESAAFGELREKQKAAEGEIKTIRESIAASMKAVDEAYGKIKAIRKKYRDLVSAFYKNRRDVSRQATKSAPAKPDTREIEDFLRRQREKLASAGIKWENDPAPAAPQPAVVEKEPEVKEPKVKAPKASKANGAAPAPAPEAAEEPKASKSKDKGVPKALRVAEWSPVEEETKTVQISTEPDTFIEDDTNETDAQRLERVSRERAEAEARRKKREDQKQQREMARADRERLEKDKKRDERKLKKLKKQEARLKGAAGSGAEASAEDTQTGEEKNDQVESAQEADDTDTGKKQSSQQSIAQRQAAAKLAEARARSEIESKLKAKRGAKLPIVGTKIPKINWQLYVSVGGALFVLLIGVFMALSSQNTAAKAS